MLSASGGIVYHARAARSLNRLLNPHGSWNPTRRHVSSWVKSWVELHKFKTLILVGPSSAYLMAPEAWSSAENLIAIDPDHIAKWVFRFRNSHAQPRPPHVQWIHRRDLLPYFSEKPDTLHQFLKNYDPQTVGILFFGCLGQMAFHQAEFKRPEAEARDILLDATRNFNVASLHDVASLQLSSSRAERISNECARKIAELDVPGKIPFSTLIDDLTQKIYALAPHLRNAELTWINHDSQWLGEPLSMTIWSLTPRKIHVLGFVERRPSATPTKVYTS